VSYRVESASYGMMYIPSFVKIGSAIQVILSLLPHNFSEVGMLVLLMGKFMKYAFKIASRGTIYG
jgi:hypothetical protein